MDCEWHSGAWIDVLNLPVPLDLTEPRKSDYRRQLEEYVDRCAMVLEDWDQRDAQWLGDFRWGWVNYERQLAYLCLDIEDHRRHNMSVNRNSALKISEVLQAFFQLDGRTQQQIHEQVQRLTDPRISKAERDRADETLAAMLRSAGEKDQAGHVLARDQRFAAAHHELRAQMEQAEATFSAALTRLMAERQLTQAQLAERIGVGQSAIAMLLKRRCRPQRRTLGKLAEALSVPGDELWPGFTTGWRSGVM